MSTQANLPEPRSTQQPARQTTDVLLIGAGIMSATLGSLIKSLEPDWSVTLLERLDGPARESSDPWNNAGTGHSALCELNYTPRLPDGSVDVSKALKINEQFQLSRQLWSYAVENGQLGDPSTFINPIPHVSFVRGEENADYLRARYDALAANPLFEGIEYIDDRDEFARRLPLMTEGRDADEKIALNWSERGTDVDFGALTRQLLSDLEQRGADVQYGRQVKNLSRDTDGTWAVKVKDLRTGSVTTLRSRFVFVGAGGGALHLLQKAGIEEIKGFAGFPVSGQFVRCLNTDIASQHRAKVYGLAPVGAPPMSVPHLDTRVIDGQPSLLFGPYAGWSPKFLKNGSLTDLARSIRFNNLMPMLGVGITSMPLVKYLVLEVLKSQRSRIEDLHAFAPTAQTEDWELITAGQRVQVVRKKGRGGSLEFGTSIISASDGSIAGLLGASPGASTSVAAMLDVIERCFGSQLEAWKPKLKEMVPSYGVSLPENPSLLADLRSWTDRTLKLAPQDEQAAQR
ncbi:malate dehydrogenase (quinone) [Aeromicrobium phragmitis]|uniref:Probable malate:quinone oxidoreductase n=1 Tax=Aeromicrobium phragmitis TaxID=2478914 RepID=A0A3L8PIX3_9ACTN|nr:malate dehydrogenase (quinone) [Aeromicrobium phragmitis]RLV54633.1 malate dehydrogenase (quinone) [Aeromicrobium phragmitis]